MMAERERIACAECGADFWRDEDQDWRVRCVPCWKRSKKERLAKIDQSEAFNDLKAELGSNIKALIALCHPDRQSNSEQANRITAWLLSLRDRLGL